EVQIKDARHLARPGKSRAHRFRVERENPLITPRLSLDDRPRLRREKRPGIHHLPRVLHRPHQHRPAPVVEVCPADPTYLLLTPTAEKREGYDLRHRYPRPPVPALEVRHQLVHLIH